MLFIKFSFIDRVYSLNVFEQIKLQILVDIVVSDVKYGIDPEAGRP